jgi:hypothetical protein
MKGFPQIYIDCRWFISWQHCKNNLKNNCGRQTVHYTRSCCTRTSITANLAGAAGVRLWTKRDCKTFERQLSDCQRALTVSGHII